MTSSVKSSLVSPTYRILFVDDDEAMRRAVPRMLAPTCEVVTAAGAREALQVLAQGQIFDGAIVDLQMPGIDGRQTIDLLCKVAPLLGSRAIIMTSGAIDPELQRWAESLGPGGMVRKPPVRDLLIDTLRERIARFPEVPLVQTKSTMRPRKR